LEPGHLHSNDALVSGFPLLSFWAHKKSVSQQANVAPKKDIRCNPGYAQPGRFYNADIMPPLQGLN
jgi:hypothetical protein